MSKERAASVVIPDIREAAAAAGLRPPDGLVPFESRAVHEPWFDRIDPFWLGFGANPSYSWHPLAKVEWVPVWHPAGPKWMARWVTETSPAGGSRKWTAPGGLVERVAALLLSWRVLTSQQIGAFGSIIQPKVSTTLRAMHQAGLVERSKMVAGASTSSSMPYLWRLRIDSKEFGDWFKSLSDDQRLALTLGVEGGSGGHDRHDILIAEIALRAAEVMPKVQAIFGERATPARDLLEGAPKVRARGDAMIVRDDGLRIILEFTTQPGIKEVARKMAQWGRLLGERGGHHHTGVIVVFVSGQYTGGGLKQLQHNYQRAITVEALGASGPADPEVLRAARASVLLADWQDWFPATWCVSNRFASLEAYYYGGETPQGKPQFFPVQTAVSDSETGISFKPVKRVDWQQPRRDRHTLPAVPRWIEGSVQRAIPREDAS